MKTLFSGKRILLDCVENIRWHVAEKTYGNNHSTLIGLIVDSWISCDPCNHSALEGGPVNGYKAKGVRGVCDAILCSNGLPEGVLEVEGTRHKETVKKIGTFFAAKSADFKSLRFAIILLYSWETMGRGVERRFRDLSVDTTIWKEITSVSKLYPGKLMAVMFLSKDYNRHILGIRSRNEYYKGEPESAKVCIFQNGRKVITKNFPFQSKKCV